MDEKQNPKQRSSRFVENGDGPLIVDTSDATGPTWDIVGWMEEREAKQAAEAAKD